jgi:hypothetical protein
MNNRANESNLKFIKIILPVFAFLAMGIIDFSPLSAQPPATTDIWEPFRFLIGEWVAEGGGAQQGQGEGSFSFSLDLQDLILVRKNHSEYPGQKGSAPISHDDLMIIYPQTQQPFKAIYFDNEGHVINYLANFFKSEDTLIFTSDLIQGAPRFRLSYIKQSADSLKISFEMARPDKPEIFLPYMQGAAHRKK